MSAEENNKPSLPHLAFLTSINPFPEFTAFPADKEKGGAYLLYTPNPDEPGHPYRLHSLSYKEMVWVCGCNRLGCTKRLIWKGRYTGQDASEDEKKAMSATVEVE